MPKLHLQIDSTSIPDDLKWLVQHIPQRLAPFNLDTFVHLNPAVLKYSGTLGTSDILEAIQPIIDHSGIRQKAESMGDDFLHVFIADTHQNGYLGIMYDYNNDPRFRQGCAVFWKQIKSLVGSKDHFRAALLRTILHEIGHCLNLDHIYGGTVMTQTNQLGGGNWIKNINYKFDEAQVDSVKDFWDDHRPGTNIMLISQVVDQAESTAPIKLSLRKFSKKRFYQGDAISFLASLQSSIDQYIPLPTDLRSENLRIWLTKPGEEKARILPSLIGCGDSNVSIKLKTGEEQLLPLHLFADKNGYLFETPGRYHLHICIRVQQEEWLCSKEITFSILKKKTIGPETLSIMYSPSVLRFISLGKASDETTLHHIRNIIDQHPTTEISRVLQWAMIRHLKESIKDQRKGKRKEALIAELLTRYQQLAQLETSSVKTGKLIYALERLSASTDTAISISDQDIANRNSYLAFDKKLIKRPQPKLKS